MGTTEIQAREILITRLLDAPRELVWKAWTDPAHLRRWWGPDDFVSTDCTIELRIGGVMRLNMRASDGSVYPCKGTFLEINEPERLVFEGDAECPHACGAGLPPRAIVTVTLEAQGDKTLLILRTRFQSPEGLKAADEMGFVAGWQSTLERLADCLSDRPTTRGSCGAIQDVHQSAC